ncbi:3-isopropylmalate dehydratase small subunit [Nocardia sp. NPDC051321]|uniref:3-isopropylmalate dehydratase small subunit n=1 Tax=Nocardia sp. NPDC051321 TaxID=3364323 RepID=UPI0037A0FC33
MQPLIQHTGRGITLRRGDIDTDQIIPAEYCKRLTKTGYADALFAEWRTEPDFILNRPSSADAEFLIAAHNFGTGSSREHAVWALRDWGFVAVVASSFGDIFRRNALKNGLIPVELPAPAVAALADQVDAEPDIELTVDLVGQEIQCAALRYGFAIDHRARRLLVGGLDEIAMTLIRDSRISAYERTRLDWLPSVNATAPLAYTGAAETRQR